MKTFSTMSAFVAIGLLFLLVSVTKARIISNDKTMMEYYGIGTTGECLATYHFYRPMNMGWNMSDPTVNTYCSTWDADKTLKWRSAHGWTAFCRPGLIPIGQSICGMCLKVTNEGTGASTIARIVDQCTKPEGGLDLDDQTVFNVIDTDGNGYFHGHMKVNYEFVSC
ncbi:unnamed protein product [Linum perenne]